MKKKLTKFLQKYFPNVWYYALYWRTAKKKLGYDQSKKDQAFGQLIDYSQGKNCLQVGVRRQKFAEHWQSVDLYDQSPLIDYHYDIHDLKFSDSQFDIIVCNAILEHVTDPLKAISEMYRVLKSGGLIWVEVPFNQPFHPSPTDYWRVTLPGLKLWLKDFTEIASGYFSPKNSPIHNGVYFYGRKK